MSETFNWGDARLPDHFWRSVSPCPMSGCWLWTGPGNHNDYGKTVLNGKYASSHRKAWMVLVGEIPSGMYLDHKCRNTRCCNPAHLRPVTPRVNAIENSNSATAINAAKTHCIRGHALSGENLFLQKDGRERQCRECHRFRVARTRRRNRAAALLADSTHKDAP